MPKILTDKEMAEIIYDAVKDEGLICCADSYSHFLESLGDLICDHFGGERGAVVCDSADSLGWTCAFKVNECVPADGGVFKNFDTDVTWKDGEET